MKKQGLFKFCNLLSICASKACWSWLQKCFYTQLFVPNAQSRLSTERKVIERHASGCRAFQVLHGKSKDRESSWSLLHRSRQYLPDWLQHHLPLPPGDWSPLLNLFWFSSSSYLKAHHTKLWYHFILKAHPQTSSQKGPEPLLTGKSPKGMIW